MTPMSATPTPPSKRPRRPPEALEPAGMRPRTAVGSSGRTRALPRSGRGCGATETAATFGGADGGGSDLARAGAGAEACGGAGGGGGATWPAEPDISAFDGGLGRLLGSASWRCLSKTWVDSSSSSQSMSTAALPELFFFSERCGGGASGGSEPAVGRPGGGGNGPTTEVTEFPPRGGGADTCGRSPGPPGPRPVAVIAAEGGSGAEGGGGIAEGR